MPSEAFTGREFVHFKGGRRRVEGLMAYAEQQQDRGEPERLNERLIRMLERIS